MLTNNWFSIFQPHHWFWPRTMWICLTHELCIRALSGFSRIQASIFCKNWWRFYCQMHSSLNLRMPLQISLAFVFSFYATALIGDLHFFYFKQSSRGDGFINFISPICSDCITSLHPCHRQVGFSEINLRGCKILIKYKEQEGHDDPVTLTCVL